MVMIFSKIKHQFLKVPLVVPKVIALLKKENYFILVFVCATAMVSSVYAADKKDEVRLKSGKIAKNEGGNKKWKSEDRRKEIKRHGKDGNVKEKGRRGLGRPRGIAKKDFKTLDKDGDRSLTFEEFSATPRLSRMNEKQKRRIFKFLDKNGDGKLHILELRPKLPRWIVEVIKNFDQYDNDGSKSLTIKEFFKIPALIKWDAQKKQRVFNRLDRNKNGEIEIKELKKAQLKRMISPCINLKEYDLDSSGGIDFEEYSKMPWIRRVPENRRKKLFDNLDLNNDGVITSDEIRKVWKERRKHGSSNFSPHGGGCARSRKEKSGSF